MSTLMVWHDGCVWEFPIIIIIQLGVGDFFPTLWSCWSDDHP
jgi:hypothetical protein